MGGRKHGRNEHRCIGRHSEQQEMASTARQRVSTNTRSETYLTTKMNTKHQSRAAGIPALYYGDPGPETGYPEFFVIFLEFSTQMPGQ